MTTALQNRTKNSMNERFHSLLKVSSVIISTLDTKSVLKSILDQTKILMQCGKSSILLVDEDKDELFFNLCASDIEYDILKDVKLKKGEGVAGKVWETKKSILLDDTKTDGRFSNKADLRLNSTTDNLIASPLMINNQVIGVLEAINKKESGFDESDILVFEALANYASIAVYNAKLYEMAICDGMTKLFIHKYFQRRLEDEFKRSARHRRELSLLMIDIDHFKNFNDSYGHQLGDEVLKKIADEIKSLTRKTDVAARYGGEEFAVVLPETEGNGAHILAERIRKKIEESEILYEDQIIKLSVSIGISSLLENNPADHIELIRMADKALYHSKQNGRNKTSFFNETLLRS